MINHIKERRNIRVFGVLDLLRRFDGSFSITACVLPPSYRKIGRAELLLRACLAGCLIQEFDRLLRVFILKQYYPLLVNRIRPTLFTGVTGRRKVVHCFLVILCGKSLFPCQQDRFRTL